MRYFQAEQVHSQAGTHYEPWQKARLSDGREVWITRQDGDGEKAFYYTDKNERVPADDLVEWMKPGAPAGNQNAAKEITASNFTIKFYPDDHQILEALLKANYEADKTKCIRKALREALERVNRHAV